MKITVISNDLRGYWTERLIYLNNYFKNEKIKLNAIQLFGKGSPYDFNEKLEIPDFVETLFPESCPEEVPNDQLIYNVNESLKSIDPDFIIAGPPVFASGAIALKWTLKNKKRLLFFDDAIHSFYKKTRLVNFIKKNLYDQADAILVPSPEYISEYKNWGIDTQKLSFGYNCVNNDRFHPSKTKESQNNWIICVARLVPVKNIEGLISAWKKVEKNSDNYELIIVGDGILKKSLENLAEELNLKKVKFLGSLKPMEIPQFLTKSKALILPSFSESWGLVVNEALASGLPVLLSNKVNACNTLLKNNVNGFSFSPENPEEIADTIIKFIQLSDAEKNEMSKNSLEIINNFSYEKFANKLKESILKIKSNNTKRKLLGQIFSKFWHGKTDTTSWDKII
ncbi:glycosyltransferase [Belliella sp. DSM 111904]|uniref:Glycosyltransferase n=1 Tax=Belliella filtrata TaxID=2923435 RepID=A0ABS9V3N9_9BACT|nr:glycosyltransferase [Belliella filtrata]MCH7410829.1 glycosyltransferase [Belliella filtrata]